MDHDSSVSVVTGYRQGNWGSIPVSGKDFFSSLQCPDWLFDHTSLQHSRVEEHLPNE
jgi:hypothetical protein